MTIVSKPGRLQPQHRLLIDLVAGREPGLADERAWRALPKASSSNQLAGMVYERVKAREDIPGDALEALKREYQLGAGSVILSEQAMFKATKTLCDAGIEYIPLKGSVFRYLLYEDSSLRPSVDIDLLVKDEDYEKASRAMLDAGYERKLDDENRPISMDTCHERGYQHPELSGFGTLIEIHSGFAQDDRYLLDYHKMWQRSLSLVELLERMASGKDYPASMPFGPKARFLDPEDTLTHLFVHATMHMFHLPLRSFLDMKLIIESWRPDFETLVARVEEAGVRCGACLCLEICKDVLDADIPAWVMRALEPGPLRKNWLQAFVSIEPVAWDGDDSMPLTFFRFPVNIRLQQALIGLPLIDDPARALRFAASYLALRGRDALAALRSDS